MISKLGGLWPVRRAAALAAGFWETFLRDNKVIPPVLAVAALFVFAWIVFGSFISAPDDEPVSSQNEVAQSEGGGGGDGQAPAPEIENPNTDSYAAYQSKDPFRQLFQSAESTTQQEDTGGDAGEDTNAEDGAEDPAPGDSSTSDDLDDSADDGFEDPGDGTSEGDPGAADDQYENGRTPREDPTDTGDTGTETPQTPAPQTPAPQNPAPQTPAPQTPPAADPGDGLFDSGGDLEDPNGR